MTWRRGGAVILCTLMLEGCATSSIRGRAVEVRKTNGDPKSPARGELIAVSPERIWVAGPDVRSIPRDEVREVRVRRHGLTKARTLRWVFLGAVISGTALALACSSVEDHNGSCGAVFLPVAITWGAIGIPSALSLGKSSELRVPQASWDTLRAYARFPQGLPEGLDPATLTPRPTPSPPK